MRAGRAVLLVGSARPRGASTSESLGTFLMTRLAEGGMDTESFFVGRCQRPEKERLLLEAVDRTDLLVLATPLYVDALPYLVTRSFERVAAHRVEHPAAQRSASPASGTRFAALVNCGFPEWEQTLTALSICRVFARQAGFSWAGGLGLGEGEAIHGQRLEDLGRRTRYVRRGLELAAEELLAGRSVPEEAQELLAQPMVPSRLYTSLATIRWWRTARRHRVLGRMRDRPLR